MEATFGCAHSNPFQRKMAFTANPCEQIQLEHVLIILVQKYVSYNMVYYLFMGNLIFPIILLIFVPVTSQSVSQSVTKAVLKCCYWILLVMSASRNAIKCN